jgi:hypothetical protein
MINLNKIVCFLSFVLAMSVSPNTLIIDAAANALAVKQRSEARLSAAKAKSTALIDEVRRAAAELQKNSQNQSAAAALQNAIAGKINPIAEAPKTSTFADQPTK